MSRYCNRDIIVISNICNFMPTLKMVLHVEETLKTTIQKKIRKSQKFVRKISVAKFRNTQTIFLRFTVTLFHSNQRANEQKVTSKKYWATSNEQKVTSNEQKVTSNEQRAKSNEQRVKSNEQRAKSNEQRAKCSASIFEICNGEKPKSC